MCLYILYFKILYYRIYYSTPFHSVLLRGCLIVHQCYISKNIELWVRGRQKRTSEKNRENLNPLVRKSSALSQPPLVHADTINFEKFDVFAPKSAHVHIWIPPFYALLALDKPLLLTADVLYERPLMLPAQQQNNFYSQDGMKNKNSTSHMLVLDLL